MEVPSNLLFEDYDPDLEDVFGRSERLTPRCVTVTAEQKADPLRKPKIVLQGILVAEKQPMSVKQIEARMLNEDGKVMDPKQYGFSNLDDLLQACPDYVIHRRKTDGTHVYMAKMNEANQDIIELVQLQSNREERHFIPSGRRGRGFHGAAFRSARGNLAKEPDRNRMTGNAQNFEARSELGAGKTAARVRNLANVLRRSRASIGKAHPDAPGRLIVTLAELQKKFFEIYALPPWGKKMTEKELHQELDKPEFSKILKFWQFREHGDVYVEEVEDSEDTSEDVRPSEAPLSTRVVFGTRRPIFDLSDDSPDVFIAVRAEQNMLLEDDDNDFLPSGPGFGGSVSNQSNVSSVPILLEEDDDDDDFFNSGPGFGGKPPPTPRARNISESQNQLAEFEELAHRFGANPGANINSFPNDEDDDEEEESLHQEVSFERNQSARHTSANITSRSISPKNPVKVLAEFIKGRGSTHFEMLPEEDKHIVNFGRSVFRVFSTGPGDVRVRLANPNMDISSLALGDVLRDPIEDDLRWMAEISVPQHKLQIAKPVMFIPPRGCLMVTEEVRQNAATAMKLETMEALLSERMSFGCVEVTKQTTRPGMPAVYLFHKNGQTAYYRVLILGRAHREGDAMALLVDHTDQHFVDVLFSDLFVLPEELGFERHPPNVVFATIYGVERMAEREQKVMWKNMNADKRKRMVFTVFGGERGNPYVDMIWRVGSGQLEWLSQIAKNGGATMSADQSAPHLKKSASRTLSSRANIDENLMKFKGLSLSESLLDEEIEASGGSVHRPQEDVFETPFSIDSLNLKAAFAKLVAEKKIAAIFAMVSFVRTVLPHVAGAETAEQLIEHMRLTALEQLGLHIEHP